MVNPYPRRATRLNTGSRGQPHVLLRTFWSVAAALGVIAVLGLGKLPIQAWLVAVCMVSLALLPSYLWCRGRIEGLPIFPIFALTFVWTYAIQLLVGHPVVSTYPEAAQVTAGLTIVGFLVLAIGIWLPFVLSPRTPRPRYLALNPSRAQSILLLILLAGILYRIGLAGGWVGLAPGANSIVRSAHLSLGGIAIFVLSHLAGQDQLPRGLRRVFAVVLGVYLITMAASLLLIGALTGFALAVTGYTLGSGRLPVRWVVLGFAMFTLLHYGKADIRGQNWSEADAFGHPSRYPAVFLDWTGFALDRFWNGNAGAHGAVQPLTERAGLLHLLVLAQYRTAQGLPYLQGYTYAPIPLLLVPRIFAPDKPPSHIGTRMLNIHFGLQRPKDVAGTTIGWGLVNEAYANFGYRGVASLAVVVGLIFGLATWWTAGAPALSFRFLFGVVMITLAIQTEFTFGVWLTVLFQYSVPLLLIIPFATHVASSAVAAAFRADARPAVSRSYPALRP